LTAYRKLTRPISAGTIANPLRLTVGNDYTRLALHSALWLFKVIQN